MCLLERRHAGGLDAVAHDPEDFGGTPPTSNLGEIGRLRSQSNSDFRWPLPRCPVTFDAHLIEQVEAVMQPVIRIQVTRRHDALRTNFHGFRHYHPENPRLDAAVSRIGGDIVGSGIDGNRSSTEQDDASEPESDQSPHHDSTSFTINFEFEHDGYGSWRGEMVAEFSSSRRTGVSDGRPHPQ
jgi:hypothetical protein